MRSLPKLLLSLLLVLILLSPFSQADPVKAQESSSDLIPSQVVNASDSDLTNQIIIKYKSAASSDTRFSASNSDQMGRLSNAAGVNLNYYRKMSGDAHVLRLPSKMSDTAIQAITKRLMALPEVEYAEPDAILKADYIPNDPRYAEQWNFTAPSANSYGIDMPSAWDITTGSSDVVVAVIDTGITNHTEFSGKILPGYDFISDPLIANDGDGRDSNAFDPGDWITSAESASGYFYKCTVSDSSWHGTHVAGIIGATTNNGIGVSGINGQVKILPVRVLGKCGGYESDIVDGISWASAGTPINPNHAQVINLSLSGPSANCSLSFQYAINQAIANGTTVVVAAGNSGQDAGGYQPANCAGVITVGATNRYGNRAYYSNFGSFVSISAPGGDSSGGILSTLNTGTRGPVSDTYANYMGTSMAAPHVAGVVSLMYSLNPNLQWGAVGPILQGNSTPFPAGSNCTTAICGQGILNAAKVLQYVALLYLPPEAFSKSSPVQGSIVQTKEPTLSWTPSTGALEYEYCFSDINPCTNWINNLTSTSVKTSSLVPGQTYYWNVRAVNNGGTTYADNSTQNWSFRVMSLPGSFTKTYPTNNLDQQPLNPILRWTQSTGASSYDYCISTSTPCSTWTNNSTSTSVMVSGLNWNTQYYWNVRAVNAVGTTLSDNSSNDWSFRTVAKPVPALTSLSPAYTLVNSGNLTLTINGTGFVSGDTASWNGVPLTTTFVSSTQLTATVNASALTSISTNQITVTDPDLVVSNALPFPVHTFADAVPTSWYWRYVEGFFAKGITTGCNSGPLRYCPDRAVTRAEMAVFILRSQHADALPYTPDPDPSVIGAFSDVPVTGKEWMQPWIEEFYQTGMTTGCNNAPLSYCPERQVTRAEMAVFVLRAVHGKDYVPPAATGVFSDVPVSGKEWMQPWIEQFYREGITTGCAQSPLRFCPEQSVTRAEMATFLDRAFGFDPLP